MQPILPVYGDPPFAVERGEGMWLWDTDGTRYLDFGAGIAVNALGHAHPRLVQALYEQAQRLWHCSNLYHIPGQTRVATKLIAHSFAEHVFFCNSGAEAVEACVKIARNYQIAAGQTERWRILTLQGGFHGRTLAMIAASGAPKYLDGFGPQVDGFDIVPLGNLNALRTAITAQTAAILVEPIQGEGGIRTADLEYLRGLRAAADEFGLLLLFDEVQSGMGRTGKLFAHEWAGITPDIMASAKGLGGGFPVGACLTTHKAASGMKVGSHGTTFGGNPLAMAVVETVLDIMLEPGFLTQVETRGRYLSKGLATLVMRYPDLLLEVRGSGLIQGLKCKISNLEMINRLRKAGLLLAPAADNVVRLLPSLIVDEAEIDTALTLLDSVCASWPVENTV